LGSAGSVTLTDGTVVLAGVTTLGVPVNFGPFNGPATITISDDMQPTCFVDFVANPTVVFTELLNFIPADVCTAMPPFNLFDWVSPNDDPSATFTGFGAGYDPATGIFDPAVAGVGTWNYTYTYTDPASGCQSSIDGTLNNGADCLALGIHTASEWGLLCLALGMLSMMTIFVQRRERKLKTVQA